MTQKRTRKRKLTYQPAILIGVALAVAAILILTDRQSRPATVQTLPTSRPRATTFAAAAASPTPGNAAAAQPTPIVATGCQASEVVAGTISLGILPRESRMRLELVVDGADRPILARAENNALGGQLTFNYDDPSASRFDLLTADLTTLTPIDSPEPEPAFWAQWLETALQPLAAFQVTEVRGFPSPVVAGQPIQFQLAGEARAKGMAKAIMWDGTITFEDRRASGTATTLVLLADWDLPPAGASGALSAATGVAITVDFVLVEVPPTPDPFKP
ncbi:MAG: hypothetical protein JXM73_14765 [Anaerolineae bacterium]|nr:hypothetical protein [Anaerolineae bacterium]